LQRVCNQLAEACPRKKAKANPKDNDSVATTISYLQQAAVLLAHHGAVLSLTDSRTTNSQSLHDAAQRNVVEWAKFLIETLHVDPNAQGCQGMTPLQFAARSGKVEMVTYLLTLPTINPALMDDRGQMPLDAAKANQKDDIVRLLETCFLSQNEEQEW
jgi:ankyrin repeat protein